MEQIFTDTRLIEGLQGSEVPELRERFGKNILYPGRQRKFLQTTIDILKEPMFIMLMLACSLYFILKEFEEGIMMLIAMVLVAAISVYQEVKSGRALAALKQLTEPRVTVIRDSKAQVILSDDLLPGDVMVLEEGNRVPADAVIIQQNDLTLNESVITGESFPVEKNEEKGNNVLLQGTTINSGKCYARVTAIGNNTELGKLGRYIDTVSSVKTLLQEQIERFVKIMALMGLIAFATIWGINYLDSKNIVQSLLFGLTIAMSVLPEEIPVAFSSFMALGAYYMAKRGIIARQPQTIENLGSVSVICLDKTGTITENEMQVKTIYDHETGSVEDLEKIGILKNGNVLRYARLASESDPFDAMEKAIVEAWQIHLDTINEQSLRMIYEYPLAGKPPMMTHVYAFENTQIVAAKGAPERILHICNIEANTLIKLQKMITEMASGGHRVIAICSALHSGGPFPVEQDNFNWKFEGLLALYDPPKKNIGREFQRWYKAGINIKIITGDYAETVLNIASRVGMKNIEEQLTGETVMQLPAEKLQELVKTTNIFSRMFPDAKLKVIDALKANGEIVAMTGDGVNDAPALRSSHIGIAMGDKGTEIAKEAADLVVTNDDIEMITGAIEQGRTIYSNLKKAIRYIISIHIPIIVTASLPLLLGWKYPNIFTPIHVIFLELIMGPTCSIFYEKEPVEPGILNRPPRQRAHSMFSGKELLVSILQGTVIATGLLMLYYYFMRYNFSIEYTRTIVFTTLLLCNILLTFVNRSFEETFFETIRYKNILAPIVLFISALFLLGIHFIGPLRKLFGLSAVNLQHFIICVGVSILSVTWFEVYKMFIRKDK